MINNLKKLNNLKYLNRIHYETPIAFSGTSGHYSCMPYFSAFF